VTVEEKATGRVLVSKKPGCCLGTACVVAKLSPTICCSISSILAFTPRSILELASLMRSSSPILDGDEASAASCSGVRPSRRMRRSMSSSRLRTKSLRRLRSTMARSSALARSPSGSSWRELISAQSVVGLATKRATLRKKLSPSLGSAGLESAMA